ncbi:hypothetical protein [Chroococcidiopsis sp [FACHB-1243]]|nr:hypothetical protein [Chroococcidiopsis sp. [FACHB-1243]]
MFGIKNRGKVKNRRGGFISHMCLSQRRLVNPPVQESEVGIN